MGKLLKLGNSKAHPVLTFLYNINNPQGLYPGILDFSLDKDNLYISEDDIRSELWKYSDIYIVIFLKITKILYVIIKLQLKLYIL